MAEGSQGNPSLSVLTERSQGNPFLAVLKEDSASSVSEEEGDIKTMKYRHFWVLHCLLDTAAQVLGRLLHPATSRQGPPEAPPALPAPISPDTQQFPLFQFCTSHISA